MNNLESIGIPDFHCGRTQQRAERLASPNRLRPKKGPPVASLRSAGIRASPNEAISLQRHICCPVRERLLIAGCGGTAGTSAV